MPYLCVDDFYFFACFDNMHSLCLVHVRVLMVCMIPIVLVLVFNICRHGVVFPHWHVRLVN